MTTLKLFGNIDNKSVKKVVENFNQKNHTEFLYDSKKNVVGSLYESDDVSKIKRALKNKGISSVVKENTRIPYSVLFESELEQAQVALAAKSIVDKLENIAGDLNDLMNEAGMPIADSIAQNFSKSAAENFRNLAENDLLEVYNSVKETREKFAEQVLKLENIVNGESNDTNDMEDDDFEVDLDAEDEDATDDESDVDFDLDLDALDSDDSDDKDESDTGLRKKKD